MKKANELLDAITKLINSRNQEAIQVFGHFYCEIEDIIKTSNKDSGRIERLLDGMLSFCYDDEILLQYKKLLRYYFPIDPEGTKYYVKAYMNMYNDEEEVE